MNKLMITGNCTKDAELRKTPSGKSVCTFTVAVNHRKKTDGQDETQFFRVTTWDALADNCAKYCLKGKKVCVVGSVSAHAYTAKDGTPGASLEVNSSEVEFLSPKTDAQTGFQIAESEDCPY